MCWGEWGRRVALRAVSSKGGVMGNDEVHGGRVGWRMELWVSLLRAISPQLDCESVIGSVCGAQGVSGSGAEVRRI